MTTTPGTTKSFEHIIYSGKRPKDDQDNPTRDKLCSVVGNRGRFHEIIPERFYLLRLGHLVDPATFISDNATASSPFIFWDPSDGLLSYEPFNMDFGPYNLATTHLFCSKIKVWVDTYDYRRTDRCIVIVLHDQDAATKLNIILVTAIAAMVLFRLSDKQVLERLDFDIRSTFTSDNGGPVAMYDPDLCKFNDVSGNSSHMKLTIEDCITGFYKAIQHDFYDYYRFDHAEYLFYETVISGDLNWIVPGKLLAFAGPSGNKPDYKRLCLKYPPKHYNHYFKVHNVSSIIRLNEAEYESADFTKAGFEHHDLIFPDGFPPTSTIANKFIKIVDEAKGAVAVHCYAGIGRTGTLIAAYLVARYDFTPQMATAWTRICRPGSVIGEQQDWLMLKFNAARSPTKSTKMRKIKEVQSEKEEIAIEAGNNKLNTTYSAAEKTYGQAQALLMTKRNKRKDSMLSKTRSLKTSMDCGDEGEKHKDITINATSNDVILDLGLTIPWMLRWNDLKQLNGTRNPDYYSILENGYEWKAKFPHKSYVTLKHEFDRDLDYFCDHGLDLEKEDIYDRVTLEFRYDEIPATPNRQECVKGSRIHNKKKPVVYYRLGKY